MISTTFWRFTVLSLNERRAANRSFDADAQVRPCAARTRLVCAGQVRR